MVDDAVKGMTPTTNTDNLSAASRQSVSTIEEPIRIYYQFRGQSDV